MSAARVTRRGRPTGQRRPRPAETSHAAAAAPRPGRPATLLALAALAGAVGGCGESPPTGPAPEIPGLPRALSVTETALVEAGNVFAFRLLRELHREAPDSNLFFSPLSASMALGMTLNGAAGATYEQMRSALGFASLEQDEINRAYRDLTDLLGKLDPRVELRLANSIWYRTGVPFRGDFLDRARTYFSARVEALDFAAPTAAATINGWVKEQTKGKIREMVENPLDARSVMFLLNAVYFKGTWATRFPKDKTVQAPFTPAPGRTRLVPLMTLEDTVRAVGNELFQAVDLPYGGKAFSMTVLLPREGRTVEEVVAWLNPSAWEQTVAALEPREATVFLPRFTLEWERLLNRSLESLGMTDAFDPARADFTRMSDQARGLEMHVSRVKQKSFVEVNEEGTEAAAVTSVEIRVTSVPDRLVFRADRPFLFLIRERFSRTILFVGILKEPR